MMKERKEISLERIELISWGLLLILAGSGWILFSVWVGRSILIGGILANISFSLLKRDLIKLFKGPLDAVKARFFIRYYFRFSLLVLILFLLIKFNLVDSLGLIAGLSTVFLGVAVAMAGETKKIFLNMKEAS